MREIIDNWWGDFPIQAGSTVQWKIGPLRIAIQRLAREWIVAYERFEPEEDQPAWQFINSDQDPDMEKFSQIARYVWQSEPEQFTVLPALADRSVVSRPFTPFTVPAGENATIYVSTPLWFVLASGTPAQTLYEVPIQRLSDTWFGPSTLEGETCYASRTHARLNLKNLNTDPYRAFTQVHVQNNAPAPLLVERLNLPVPYLSLFHTQAGLLWTETVTVVQTRGTSLAEFNIEKEPPPAATGAKLLVEPRKNPHKGMLIRAFSALTLQGFD
jgi:hypothetical protein